MSIGGIDLKGVRLLAFVVQVLNKETEEKKPVDAAFTVYFEIMMIMGATARGGTCAVIYFLRSKQHAGALEETR